MKLKVGLRPCILLHKWFFDHILHGDYLCCHKWSEGSFTSVINVTRFAKTRHNDAFLEIQIFASMNSINLKLCSVVISMLYYKYFSSYKVRQQEKQYITFVRIPMAINVTRV